MATVKRRTIWPSYRRFLIIAPFAGAFDYRASTINRTLHVTFWHGSERQGR